MNICYWGKYLLLVPDANDISKLYEGKYYNDQT